jgi:peptidoglycan/LPS O-acetylase OafA/YrhL
MQGLTPATSFALDLLRAGAAQAVCIGHTLSYFGFYPQGVPYIQSIAVLLFFLISGFLIATTLCAKANEGLGCM